MVEFLASLAGVLGFVFSIALFLLTRWERRQRVVIELECSDLKQFSQHLEDFKCEDTENYDSAVVLIRVEIALFQNSFEQLLGANELKPYMNEKDYWKTEIPLSVMFSERRGRKFIERNYFYFFYVSDFIHKKIN